MEAKMTGKKRKQQSNLFAGALTRGKAQVYLHLNRSGRSRPDTFPERCRVLDSYSPASSILESSTEGVVMSRRSIKDLRARRVFSEPLVVEEHQKKPLGQEAVQETVNEVNSNSNLGAILDDSCGEQDGIHACNEEVVLADSASRERFNIAFDCGENPLFEVLPIRENPKEDLDVGFGCGGQRLNDMSPDFSKKERVSGLCNNQESEGKDPLNLDEEIVQTTPPDPDIYVWRNADDDETNTEDGSLKIQNNVKGIPSKECKQEGCSPVGFNGVSSARNDSNSNTKLVLNPCSRMKVFKAPSSFSYRRLLPYLMEIAKDNSRELKLEEGCKVEIEEKPPRSIVDCTTQELSNDISMGEKFSAVYVAGDSNTQNASSLVPIYCSSNESQLNLVSSKSQMRSQVFSDKLGMLDLRLDTMNAIDAPHGVALPLASGASKLESLAQDLVPIFEENGEDNRKMASLMTKDVTLQSSLPFPSNMDTNFFARDSSLETHKDPFSCARGAPRTVQVTLDKQTTKIFQNSSSRGVGISSEVPMASPEKGILKRNPRGCRGFCPCLNCTSFRLHAEKAFEFSRHQLQDAEELVLHLLQQLSCLRGILESSVDGGHSHAIFPYSQAKEACTEASEAEQLARNQLAEMNAELYVHCRTKSLHRPRVNFSVP